MKSFISDNVYMLCCKNNKEKPHSNICGEDIVLGKGKNKE